MWICSSQPQHMDPMGRGPHHHTPGQGSGDPSFTPGQAQPRSITGCLMGKTGESQTCCCKRSVDGEALNSKNRQKGISMNPKLGTEGQWHPAHTNNLTGVSASGYVCLGGRGWEIRNTDLCPVSDWFLGNKRQHGLRECTGRRERKRWKINK